jgi:hypothetical protein
MMGSGRFVSFFSKSSSSSHSSHPPPHVQMPPPPPDHHQGRAAISHHPHHHMPYPQHHPTLPHVHRSMPMLPPHHHGNQPPHLHGSQPSHHHANQIHPSHHVQASQQRTSGTVLHYLLSLIVHILHSIMESSYYEVSQHQVTFYLGSSVIYVYTCVCVGRYVCVVLCCWVHTTSSSVLHVPSCFFVIPNEFDDSFVVAVSYHLFADPWPLKN